jgi:hypothetical protein
MTRGITTSEERTRTRAGELVQAVKFSNAILHGLYFNSRRDKVQVIFDLMDSALAFAALPDTAIFLHIE